MVLGYFKGEVCHGSVWGINVSQTRASIFDGVSHLALLTRGCTVRDVDQARSNNDCVRDDAEHAPARNREGSRPCGAAKENDYMRGRFVEKVYRIMERGVAEVYQ